MAAEHLARIDDLSAIIAHSERFTCDLVPCDEARISLGNAVPAFDGKGWTETLRIALPSPGGGRIGWLSAGRLNGPAFTVDDEAVFEHLSRVVALALQVGRQKAEAEEARSRSEMLLARIGDGVAEFDRELRFVSVNEAAIRGLRLADRGDVGGTSLWDLGPGHESGQFGALCQTAIETDRPVWATADFAALKAVFDLRAFPHPDGVTALFRDVTIEREAEQRLPRTMRLETMEQLTGGVAHDVNNLLTVILGNFEALADTNQHARRETDRGLAMEGLRAAESATGLIHRLLTYSRGQSESARAIDVAGLLQSLEPLVQRCFSRRIRARITSAAGLWPAQADPVELESAVLNLALNAQDAIGDGGFVDIAAENVEVDESYACTGGFDRTGSFVMLSVTDHGIGMSDETVRRAFDPFFTTKRGGTGFGLGLSMVRGFARRNGGHVLIDSEPGRGTVVRLYLQRARRPGTPGFAPLATPAPARLDAAAREHILLVEDNLMVRAHAAALLAKLSYRVTTAADAAEAMRLLRGGLEVDLLFTDVTLSGQMDGHELAQAAAVLRPGLSVLYTSGHVANALMHDGRLLPGVALLPKPFRSNELAAAVRGQLDAVAAHTRNA